jgi:hypothetical protein
MASLTSWFKQVITFCYEKFGFLNVAKVISVEALLEYGDFDLVLPFSFDDPAFLA